MGACSSKPKTTEYEGLMAADSKFDDFGRKSVNTDRKSADVDSGRMIEDANISAANKASERSLQTLFVKYEQGEQALLEKNKTFLQDVLPDSEKAQKQSNDGIYEDKALDKHANETLSFEEQRPEDGSGVGEALDSDKLQKESNDGINVEKPHEPANETASLEEQLPKDVPVVVEAKEIRHESRVPLTIIGREVDVLATEGTTSVETVNPSLKHQTYVVESQPDKVSAAVEIDTPNLPAGKEGLDQAPLEMEAETLIAKIEPSGSEGPVGDELPGSKSETSAESGQPDEPLVQLQETPGLAVVIGRATDLGEEVVKAVEEDSVNETAPFEGYSQGTKDALTSDVFYESREREVCDEFDGVKTAMATGLQSASQIVSDTYDLASEKAVQLEESSHDSAHDAKVELQEQDACLTQPAPEDLESVPPELPSSTILPKELVSVKEENSGAVSTVILEQSEQEGKKVSDAVSAVAGDQFPPIKTPNQPVSVDTSLADISTTDLGLPGASGTREMLSTELSEKEAAADAPVEGEYPNKTLDTVVQSVVETGTETKVASDTPVIELFGREAAIAGATDFTEAAPSGIEAESGSAVRKETEPADIIPELNPKPEVENLASVDATEAVMSLADSSEPRSTDMQASNPGVDKASTQVESQPFDDVKELDSAIVAVNETSHIINDETSAVTTPSQSEVELETEHASDRSIEVALTGCSQTSASQSEPVVLLEGSSTEPEVTNAAVLDPTTPDKELLETELGSDSDLAAQIQETTQLQVQPEEESKELESLRRLEDYATKEIPVADAAESLMSYTTSVGEGGDDGTIVSEEKALTLTPQVVEPNETALSSTDELETVKIIADSQHSTESAMASEVVREESPQVCTIKEIQSESALPLAGEVGMVNAITEVPTESAVAPAASKEEGSSQVNNIKVSQSEESSTRIPDDEVDVATSSAKQMEEGGLTALGTETEEPEGQLKPVEGSSMVLINALEEKTHQVEQLVDGEGLPEGACTSTREVLQSETSVEATQEERKELILAKVPVEEADDSKNYTHESLEILESLSLLKVEADSGAELAGNKDFIEESPSLAETSEKTEIEKPALAESDSASSQAEGNLMPEHISNTQAAEQAIDIHEGSGNLASEHKRQASVEIGDKAVPIAPSDMKGPVEDCSVSSSGP